MTARGEMTVATLQAPCPSRCHARARGSIAGMIVLVPAIRLWFLLGENAYFFASQQPTVVHDVAQGCGCVPLSRQRVEFEPTPYIYVIITHPPRVTVNFTARRGWSRACAEQHHSMRRHRSAPNHFHATPASQRERSSLSPLLGMRRFIGAEPLYSWPVCTS